MILTLLRLYRLIIGVLTSQFIHEQSHECAKSELDIFAVPPTQTSVEKGALVPYQPIASITDGGPIEFYIPGAGDEYIDLAQTQLYVRAKITNADGTNLEAAAPVGPANLFLHSLFNQVDARGWMFPWMKD